MGTPKAYIPTVSRWFYRILRWTYGRWILRALRVHSYGLELFDSLKGPYVIIPNHQSHFDGFIVGALSPEPVYWIVGDGNMRSSIIRFLLSLIGSIPKSKSIPDLETVGNIVRVIRKKRGVVGIFAEGQSSWNGKTQPTYASTAKLIKLLKVPVVIPHIHGMFFTAPRWAKLWRTGVVEVEFKLILTETEIKTLTPDKIQERIEAALAHDEYAWLQQQKNLRWMGPGKAGGLELAYFLCPRCGAIGTLKGKGNYIRCAACTGAAVLTGRGMLLPSKKAPFLGVKTLQDWDVQQDSKFRNFLYGRMEEQTSYLLKDCGAILYKGRRLSPLQKIGVGLLELIKDGIIFTPGRNEKINFSLPEIEGIGTLKKNILEFYIGKIYYRVCFLNPSVSARKWQRAVEIILEDQGALHAEDPGLAFYS